MKREEYDNRNYDPASIEEDPRFTICFKEAKLVMGFWVTLVALIMIVMYTIGATDPSTYTYTLGLPTWFAIVCGIFLVFIAIAIYIARHVLKDMPLDDVVDDAATPVGGATSVQGGKR